jgi:hypothetical protein
MAEVFVCRKGSISKRSIIDLRAAGVVVVEADDPSSCTFIRSTETVPTDDLLWCALSALNSNKESFGEAAKQRAVFAARMFEIVDEARKSGERKGG